MNDRPPDASVRLVGRESSRIWPMLLRAGAMSVHPGRIAIGFVACLVILGAGLLFDSVYRAVADSAVGRFDAVLFHWRYWLFGVYRLPENHAAMSGPHMPELWDVVGFFRGDIVALVLLAVIAWVYALASGAMSRMVGVDIAADADMSTRHAVRFSLVRWKALLIAHWVPIGIIILVMVALGAFGKALLSVEGVSVIGALLFGVAVLAGVLAMGACLALLLGGWMLAPAVVCESTDGVDAIQRCFAYVFKRVGHTLLYLAILIGVGLVAFWIVRLIVIGGYAFASVSATRWISDERAMALGEPSATRDLLRFWRWVCELLVSGWVLSYVASGATLMYLALRRVCDDQDPRDLWMEAGRREPVMPELAEQSGHESDHELA